MSNCFKKQAFRLLWSLTLVFLCVVVAAPAAAQTPSQPAQEPGVHFIVLIDDSDSMRNRAYQIPNVLPGWLFDGLPDNDDNAEAVPTFNPNRDRLSVLFFTIPAPHPGQRRCDGVEKRLSAGLPYMFEWRSAQGVTTKEQFTDALDRWLNEMAPGGLRCRFNGRYSPILTAPPLALPYVQTKLEGDSLYARTLIIEATDDEFNMSGSPAGELANFRRGGVEATTEAAALSDQVADLFRFKSLRSNLSGGNVNYYILEALPLVYADGVLNYPARIALDRMASSKTTLRVMPATEEMRVLRISQNERLRPVSLKVGFSDLTGENPWLIGTTELPAQAYLDLEADCTAPTCRATEAGLEIRLFDAAAPGLSITSRDAELEGGVMSYEVGFKYETGALYEHVYVLSSRARVEVAPEPGQRVSGRVFFPGVWLDNKKLAARWNNDDDGLTSQAEARESIRSRQFRMLLFLFFVLIVSGLIVLYLYYQQAGHRRFKPQLKWQPVSEVVIDFNRPAFSYLLVGTFEVLNKGAVPRFARFLKNTQQPTHDATVSLIEHKLEETKVLLKEGVWPLGFIQNVHDDARNGAVSTDEASTAVEPESLQADALKPNLIEAVSDGKQFYVFLAAEAIKDYQASEGVKEAEEAKVDIDFSVEMRWHEQDNVLEKIPLLRRWSQPDEAPEDRRHVLEQDAQFLLTIKPEQQRKPHITFHSEKERVDFKKGQQIPLGTFRFQSQAEHLFAETFISGEYAIRAYKGHHELGVEAIQLDREKFEDHRVALQPRQTFDLDVLFNCDGETVLNPEPHTDDYTFRIIGDYGVGSDLGPHTVTLHRDPQLANIVLLITHPTKIEVYWDQAGAVQLRPLNGTRAPNQRVEGQDVFLESYPIGFDADTGEFNLLTLEIGNSARSGEGSVQVHIEPHVRFLDRTAQLRMHMHPRQDVDDLLEVYHFADVSREVSIRENADHRRERRDVRIFPEYIKKIDAAYIRPHECQAEITLKVFVQNDVQARAGEGEGTRREVIFIVPLDLEQLPGKNWLAIDFGTSSVAAALGSGRMDHVYPVELQQIELAKGKTLATEDPSNTEAGSAYLIPSWISCDADLRQEKAEQEKAERERAAGNGAPGKDMQWPPGFGGYVPKTLRPGAPGFVSLPAFSSHLINKPGRIVYSIKYWLTKSSQNIRLDEPVTYEDEDGNLVESNTLPLQAIVESGFAALGEAYLRQYGAEQLVISHPNTFTQRHKEILHDIVWRAYARRFGIAVKERIRLISESDAVAYYYCREERWKRTQEGSERLLIYDFGAGTLDLSIINITWQKGATYYPAKWTVEGRLGVPVAGIYLDQMLARIIHSVLTDKDIIDEDFDYQYPIVSREQRMFDNPDKRQAYRRAMIRLWGWIRESKHKWDGKSPFRIRIGIAGTAEGVVRYFGDEERLEELRDGPSDDEVGIWADGLLIGVSIPASVIHMGLMDFIDFVAKTVVEEQLRAAGLERGDIDTVVVSGRGALWPGLKERIESDFPDAYFHHLGKAVMKNAVVLGAIARQDLLLSTDGDEDQWPARLGILVDDDEALVDLGEEEIKLDLSASRTFRLVQVNLTDPNPREDMRSFRRHFYIDLVGHEFSRDEWGSQTRYLYVSKEVHEGKLEIIIDNKSGRRRSIFTQARSSQAVTAPPWPIGAFFLSPDPWA